MNFDNDIILDNELVLLKPFSKEDFDGFAEIAFNERIWEGTTPMVLTEDDLGKYMDRVLREKENKIRYPFTIIDRSKNKIAGSTSFLNISEFHKRLEIGSTWLGIEFQRTGLNRVCKFLLGQYVFEELKYERLEFKTDALNEQSRNALKKIGAKEEGILRSHMEMNFGRRRDSVYYSILKDEWPKIKETVFREFWDSKLIHK
ncbi:MAG: GNAT family N-acetyltransferase [Bacteroidetes bacterium]|nr:MAG: GNAT family N-acetyltransferase [Bacteroidota bacterium]